MPILFVLIWSTGFIVAHFGLPFAEPLTFLAVRFLGALLVLTPIVWSSRAPWPPPVRRWREIGHMSVAGVLMQAGFLTGVWSGIKLGMPAGVSALIVGTQPLLTALAARWVGERLKARQWLGMLVGFAGVALVVSGHAGLHGVTWQATLYTVFALFSITVGTLYQKRFCQRIDMRVGNLIQFAASLAIIAPLALLLEANAIQWTPRFEIALLWSVLALSVGAGFLLFALIRQRAATEVTSLFYLTPPTTALLAWLLFGEALSPLGIAGLLVAATGVALVVKR